MQAQDSPPLLANTAESDPAWVSMASQN